MIFFAILSLILLIAFGAINLGSAVAALVGGSMIVLQLVHRSKNSWLWLLGLVSFLGGVGSLTCAWGLYYAVIPGWPESIWPEVSWVAGYLGGGAAGVIIGVVEVMRWKKDDVKRTFEGVADFFAPPGMSGLNCLGEHRLKGCSPKLSNHAPP